MKEKEWITVEHPGYLGRKKELMYRTWNSEYGCYWRLVWELADKTVLDYEEIFSRIYVPGYAGYLLNNPKETLWLAATASYTYDKDLITREQAFDPNALYEKPNTPNQFHNVALNIALEYNLGVRFAGENPLQVREGKPGTNPDDWPIGWRFSPGRIPTIRPDLIPNINLDGWWKKGSIEDLYQKAKVLQINDRTPHYHRLIRQQKEKEDGGDV